MRPDLHVKESLLGEDDGEPPKGRRESERLMMVLARRVEHRQTPVEDQRERDVDGEQSVEESDECVAGGRKTGRAEDGRDAKQERREEVLSLRQLLGHPQDEKASGSDSDEAKDEENRRGRSRRID